MKFAAALCLFACVAVSHAAFSGSLVQQAKPLVNQAMFKIRLATVSRSSDGAQLQTEIVAGLQAHIDNLLSQIESGVEIATGVYDDILAQIQQTQSEIAALAGGVSAHVTEIVSSLLENLNNLWGSIFGKAVNQKGLFDFLGSFDLEAIIQQIKDHIHGLVSQIDILAVAQTVLSEHLNLPGPIVSFILGHLDGLLNNNSRGLFDTVWQHLSGLTASLVEQIQTIAQSLIASGTQSFNQIQALAQQFVDHAQTEAAEITGAAAQQLLEFLAPYQQDLGALWEQVQSQVAGIISVLPINN